LQQKLVEQVKAIGDKGAWMEIGISEALHQYCDGVRDLQYMQECSERGAKDDPFLLSTANILDAKLLEDAGLAWRDPKSKLPQLGPNKLECTKRISPSTRRLRRLFMAILGGLAVIAPFLIMSLLKGQIVRLVVSCAAMVVFGAGVALITDLAPETVGLITAAYAAALVVFVGTNPPPFEYS
jgi:hypothetical protein